MTAVLPLRGALVASGLLFGAQHMQVLPSCHPLPSGLLLGAPHSRPVDVYTKTRLIYVCAVRVCVRVCVHICMCMHVHVHVHVMVNAISLTHAYICPRLYICLCVCTVQVGLLLPLSVTGFVWGVLYVGSGNLLVPILIHALWNTRVFLGSYLGL